MAFDLFSLQQETYLQPQGKNKSLESTSISQFLRSKTIEHFKQEIFLQS